MSITPVFTRPVFLNKIYCEVVMALVKCKECRKEVSNKAAKCPHCGVKRLTANQKIGIFVFLVFVFFVFVCWIAPASDDDAATKTSSVSAVVNKEDDAKKLIAYDKQVKQIVSSLGDSSDIYKSMASIAAESNDATDVYSAAIRLKQATEVAGEELIELQDPSFGNGDLKAVMDDYKGAAKIYIYSTRGMADLVAQIANKGDGEGGVPELMTRAKDFAEQAQESKDEIDQDTYKAYALLGYKEKDVDVKFGGLLAVVAAVPTELSEKCKVLGTFKWEGGEWTMIAISPSMSKEDFISFAKKLHADNPDMNYEIFDAVSIDPAKWVKYITTHDPVDKKTEAEFDAHNVATINQMLDINTHEMKWQITWGLSDNKNFNDSDDPVDL